MMPKWYASEPGGDWLVESDLRLETETEHKAAGDEPALRTLRGRRNRVQLGVPQTIDVFDTWPSNERLDAEVEALRKGFDLHCIRLAISLVPDRGCRFTFARLDISLSATDVDAAEPPVTLDLFPREVGAERKFARSFGLKGGAKLAFAELSLEGKSEGEAIVYEPTLIGAGLLTDSPSWNFSSDRSRGLAGARELFLLVKIRKGLSLGAQFAIAAEVTTVGGLGRYFNDRLLDATYPIAAASRSRRTGPRG